MAGPTDNYGREAQEHERMRKMLVPAFSAPRMRRLTERIQELTESCLDDMEAAREARPDEPVDLNHLLAFPLPMHVICELLGVPAEDRGPLHGVVRRLGSINGGDDALAAMGEDCWLLHRATWPPRGCREPGQRTSSPTCWPCRRRTLTDRPRGHEDGCGPAVAPRASRRPQAGSVSARCCCCPTRAGGSGWRPIWTPGHRPPSRRSCGSPRRAASA
ncbi:hypothetical protein ACRAWF_30370 [Streptomyces sp. L7]